MRQCGRDHNRGVVDVTDRPAAPTGDQDERRQFYDGLAEVVVAIAGASNLEDGCALLAAYGVRHLGAQAAGVSRLSRRGGFDLLAATDPVVAVVGSRREPAETVPVTAPLAEGELVVLADMGSLPGRTLQPVAAQLGFRSALLVGLPPLSSGAVTLELYSREPNAFDDIAHGAGARLTAHVIALGGTALRDLERRVNLGGAVVTRGVIGQAQGIVMRQYALTGDQAMAYLRRHSQASQQPVRELAAEIVARHEAGSRARASDDVP